MSKENKIIALMVCLCLIIISVFTVVKLDSTECNIAAQFKIPETIAATVYNLLNASSTAITIATIVGILATGGVGVFGAAARTGVVAYLKQKIKGKTRAKAIAW